MTGFVAASRAGGATAEERLARAALSRLAEPGDEALALAVSLMGAPAVLTAIHAGDLIERLTALGSARYGSSQDSDGFGDEAVLAFHRFLTVLQRNVSGYRSRLPSLRSADDIAVVERLGGRLVCPPDDEWPPGLDDLGGRAPLALWVRGPHSLSDALTESVAMVGARAATGYGAHVASEIAAGLGDRGWTVVSGAAYGIDAAAHRGALAVTAPTIAVVASGIDRHYPQGHAALIDRIAEEGLVVSEMPPGAAPTRLRFLDRNRLIAAMTRGTVVVEAGLRSGARNTAGWAQRLGRPTMAVPGPVTSSMSAGCHVLIRTGSVLVTDAAEVVEHAGRIGADLAPQRSGPQRPRDGLDALTARVLEAVPAVRAASAGRVAVVAGLDPGETVRRLEALLAAGLVERRPSGWRLAQSGRGDA